MMRVYEKARGHVFARFDAFNFIGFLKILVKTAIMRPVAMVNQAHENRLLISLIEELMKSIEDYKQYIELNKIVPEAEKN